MVVCCRAVPLSADSLGDLHSLLAGRPVTGLGFQQQSESCGPPACFANRIIQERRDAGSRGLAVATFPWGGHAQLLSGGA